MKLRFHCERCRRELSYVPLPRRINGLVIGVCRECVSEFDHEGPAEDMIRSFPTADWEIEVTESGRPAVSIAGNRYFFDDPQAIPELSAAHSAEELAYLVLALAKTMRPS